MVCSADGEVVKTTIRARKVRCYDDAKGRMRGGRRKRGDDYESIRRRLKEIFMMMLREGRWEHGESSHDAERGATFSL
jgi:hypothetical protein